MKDEAFGIIPILQDDSGEMKFLLIQHLAGHWAFPKGHAEAGETAIATARRELAEETGIKPYQVFDDTPFVEHYSFMKDDQQVEKTVTYFIGLVQGDTVTCQEQEVQDYAWVNFDTALEKITFNQGKQLLQRVFDYLQTHPLPQG